MQPALMNFGQAIAKIIGSAKLGSKGQTNSTETGFTKNLSEKLTPFGTAKLMSSSKTKNMDTLISKVQSHLDGLKKTKGSPDGIAFLESIIAGLKDIDPEVLSKGEMTTLGALVSSKIKELVLEAKPIPATSNPANEAAGKKNGMALGHNLKASRATVQAVSGEEGNTPKGAEAAVKGKAAVTDTSTGVDGSVSSDGSKETVKVSGVSTANPDSQQQNQTSTTVLAPDAGVAPTPTGSPDAIDEVQVTLPEGDETVEKNPASVTEQGTLSPTAEAGSSSAGKSEDADHSKATGNQTAPHQSTEAPTENTQQSNNTQTNTALEATIPSQAAPGPAATATGQTTPSPSTEGMEPSRSIDRGIPTPGQNSNGEKGANSNNKKRPSAQAINNPAASQNANPKSAVQSGMTNAPFEGMARAAAVAIDNAAANANLGTLEGQLSLDPETGDLVMNKVENASTRRSAPSEVMLRFDRGRMIAVPHKEIAMQIVRHSADGHGKFEIQIDPKELGRIQIKLDVTDSGKVTAHMIVEKSDTLDLLNKDSKQLQKALADAGLDADGSSLSFSLKEQNPQDQRDSRKSTSSLEEALIAEEEVEGTTSGALPAQLEGIRLRRLDISA